MQKNITGSLDDVVMQLFKCHLKKTEGPVVVLLCTSKRCDMFANKIEELLDGETGIKIKTSKSNSLLKN